LSFLAEPSSAKIDFELSIKNKSVGLSMFFLIIVNVGSKIARSSRLSAIDLTIIKNILIGVEILGTVNR
jgi:hypothetical protein